MTIKWPTRIPAAKQGIKAIPIAFRGLIQILHFSAKEKAPTPSELRRHDVWPSWFHKKAKACCYKPSDDKFVIVSTIYVIEAIRVKYRIDIPYSWDVLEGNLDSLLKTIYFRLALRPVAKLSRAQRQTPLPYREEMRTRDKKRVRAHKKSLKRRGGIWNPEVAKAKRLATIGRTVTTTTNVYVPPAKRPWHDSRAKQFGKWKAVETGDVHTSCLHDAVEGEMTAREFAQKYSFELLLQYRDILREYYESYHPDGNFDS